MSRILVIEDSSGDARVLKSRLAVQNYEVVHAEGGAQALALAREQGFGAILVSARLKKGLDPIELCRRLRGMPELDWVPILFYSEENGMPESAVRAFEAKANGFVVGSELPTLEAELRQALRMRARMQELTEALRTLQEQLRRPGSERARGEAEASNGRETPEHQAALRELAQGRPDAMLLVDSDGTVLHADRGACELLGARLEGQHLGHVLPGRGLEAFVRDTQNETREGFRFDLPARKGRGVRAMTATVVPLVAPPGQHELPRKAVLFQDALRRRIAAEALRTHEPGISRAELGPLLEAARLVYRPADLRGSTPAMQALRTNIARIRQGCGPVLILGERGTGKERVARTLHYGGSTTGAFVQLRCVGLSPESQESEIFGLVRQPARGHLHDRPGLLHLAQDGMLYLDEVAELSLELQARLLNFLRDGSVCRAGTSKPERLEVRLVLSTERELPALCQAGRFRRDLAEELARTQIELPALRTRKDDLEELLAHGLARFAPEGGVEIAPETLRVLHEYDWPGNVQELEDCLEFSCARALARDGNLRIDDLPRALQDFSGELPQRDIVPVRPPDGAPLGGTHTASTGLRSTPARGVIQVPSYREIRPWDITDDDPVSLDLYEKKALMRALSVVDNDKLAAAKLLKLGKSTMYRKLKRYGIP